jgi:hypothetical protein
MIKMSVFQQFLQPFKILNTNDYYIPMEKYNELNVSQWKHNRPADMKRVDEIHNWMKQFNRMDGVINLACVSGYGLVCFDGNHRRLALKGLDITVKVNIVWDATDEIVTHEFRRINQSISVPDLYIEENDAIVIANVQNAVSEFIKRFDIQQSTAKNPQRPNFNRDNLTNQLFNLQKERNISIADLMTRNYSLNDALAIGDKTNLNEKIIKKCSEGGLWLFARSKTINLN